MAGFQFQEDGDPQNPALLLANSLLAGNAMWDAQTAVWSQRYRVLRFHYAGHGARCVPVAFTEVTALATFLLQALEHLGIERFHCVGLSLGGMVGLQLALQAPERLDRLVIANCRAYQLDAGKAMWDERIAMVRESGVGAVIEETLSRWFTDGFRMAHPATIDRVRHMMQGVSSSGYRAAAAMVRGFDALAGLDAVSCPTLVLAGAQDGAAPVAHLQDIARQLHATFLTLDPCAHLSNIECAEAFTSAVTEFLSKECGSTVHAIRQDA